MTIIKIMKKLSSKYMKCPRRTITQVVIRGILANHQSRISGMARLPYPAFQETVISFPIDGWLSNIQNKFINGVDDPEYLAVKRAADEYDDLSDDIDILSLAIPRIILISTVENRVGGDAQEYCNKGSILFVRCQNEKLLQSPTVPELVLFRYLLAVIRRFLIFMTWIP